MTNSQTTKRSLLGSSIALLLCFAMLLGTTFAWFTDSATSAGNRIQAGNLDVNLLMWDGDKYVDISGQTGDIFAEADVANNSNATLWEPGKTQVVYLAIENAGNLDLKYNVNIKAYKDAANTVNDIDMTPVMRYAITPDVQNGTGVGPWDSANAKEVALGMNTTQADYVDLPKDATHYFALSVHMLEEAGNEYKDASVLFDLIVNATQLAAEYDSFDNQYDADAKYPGEVGTAAELATALANNESVKLLNNITLTGEWTPIGNKDEGIYYTGTLDGNGYTISGLSVTNGDYVALISAAKNATIMNLTVEGSVEGENAAGVVARVEGNTVIKDVTSNVTVKGTTKAGGIACNVTNSGKTVFTNCVNEGAVSGGDSGIGGIVGYVNNDAYVEIIACANNANVTSNNKYAGAAVGYAAGTSKGIVADMENTGTVTGTLINDGRFLKYGDTVLCGYVGTIGNWVAALIATPANVQTVITNALKGATIQLSAGKYGMITAKSNITIQGVSGAVVDCVNLNGAKEVNLLNIEFNAAGAQAAYQYNKDSAVTYANIVGGSKTSTVGARNIVIDGCTFTGKFAEGGAAIAFVDRSRPTGGSGDVTIKNCTFNTKDAYYDIYGYYTGSPNMTFAIENNTFASDCLGLPVYLGRLATSEAIVVKGNNFKTTDSLDNSVYIQAHSATYTPTLEAANNTFGG